MPDLACWCLIVFMPARRRISPNSYRSLSNATNKVQDGTLLPQLDSRSLILLRRDVPLSSTSIQIPTTHEFDAVTFSWFLGPGRWIDHTKPMLRAASGFLTVSIQKMALRVDSDRPRFCYTKLMTLVAIINLTQQTGTPARAFIGPARPRRSPPSSWRIG